MVPSKNLIAVATSIVRQENADQRVGATFAGVASDTQLHMSDVRDLVRALGLEPDSGDGILIKGEDQICYLEKLSGLKMRRAGQPD